MTEKIARLRELRRRVIAPLWMCVRALVEAHNDIDQAIVLIFEYQVVYITQKIHCSPEESRGALRRSKGDADKAIEQLRTLHSTMTSQKPPRQTLWKPPQKIPRKSSQKPRRKQPTDEELLHKYVDGVDTTDAKLKPSLIPILRKLDAKKRLSPKDVIWLQEKYLFYNNIAHTYHSIEAIFYEQEYQRTQDLWNIANASSHWRKAKHPKKAIKLTENIRVINIHEQKLKSALLTTRGGALRDTEMFEAAEICALKAIFFQPESYRPYNLVGALYYDRRQYDEGDMWFEEAIQRGATPNDVDAELKRIVKRTKGKERQQLIHHLLKKDPIRYAWVQGKKRGEQRKKQFQKEKRPKKSPFLPQRKEVQIPVVFRRLLDIIKELNNGKQEWIAFSDINKALRKQGVRIEDYQYTKFKPLMLEAEQRGLVKIRQKGQQWDAKLCPIQGLE